MTYSQSILNECVSILINEYRRQKLIIDELSPPPPNADFLKKSRGFSAHALEQFLYNIHRKALNQEMPRTFSRIFTATDNQIKHR